MDLSEYVVSGWDPPDSGELAEFEVQMKELVPSNSAPSGAGTDDSQWVRSCVELPGYARGWVPSSPSHSTMLYTMMQVDTSSSEDQVIHGRASTEQT